MTPGLIRQTLLDPEYDPAVRDWTQPNPWDALAQLPHEEQIAILRDVVEHGPMRSAAPAVNGLIQLHDVESAEIIAERLPDLPDGVGLQVIAYTDHASEFAPIPRRTLARHIDQHTPYQPTMQTGRGVTVRILGAIDQAATLLGRSGQPEDLALLRDAAVEFPDCPEIWIALASHPGSLEPAQQALAMARYGNPELSPELRAATAAALAPTNPDAAEVAEQLIGAVLDEYESFNPAHAVADAVQNPEGEEVQRYYRFFSDGRILAGLRVLTTPEAQILTARSLRAANPQVRSLGAVIAADRWPDLLINNTYPQLTQDERNGALALVGRFHPELIETARGAAPNAVAFDELLDRVEADQAALTMTNLGLGDAVMRYLGIN